MKDDNIRAHWRCFMACGIMSLAFLEYGIDFGVIGGLQAMPGFLQVYGYRAKTSIGWNISTTRQQLIASLMTLGAFISSGTAGLVAAKLGRKTCLWLACLLCVVSTVIMMTTETIGPLYVARFLIGLANGYFLTFSQLYTQESSPAKYRGLFLTSFQFITSLGTLIGNIIDWGTQGRPDKTAYLIPLGIVYLVPILMSVGLLFIPESPRWLILQNRIEDSRKSLAWLRPNGRVIESEVAEIRNAIAIEREMGGNVGVLDMFKHPIDRRRTGLSVGAVSLRSASGSMFIIAFKTYFLTMAKVSNPFAMSIIISIAGLIAIALNAGIVVRYGRRRVLLMVGLIGCGCLQLIIAVVYDQNPDAVETGRVLVALSCLYMMGYSGMVGTYAWVSGGEIPSQRLRSYTFGLASAIGFLGGWVITFTAPYFINPDSLNWGPRYGYIWFPSCVVGAIWVYFFLPETHSRTLEDIDEMFTAELSARRFRSYDCQGVAMRSKGDDIVVPQQDEP
ncbi:hypothetical protein JX265_008979 [Neoarthrinium moseri]|uniref:Major facilitator superfamily (MFS) profile domain-containing protein n=1 Tax=Neoarthrinium moseri TaxID=1658444 RepID=A0A9P9WGU3_9PEZI|nr:uncharacterized protein JN550_007849 [Neoarthrinium moseri]KAI1862933.1 hypothetical protein JX265_008979 [Neoarthrinium moseri]KAI1866160.1 hypothetical protein JN550_007849 [Neoarthrinium moseri]